MPVIMKDNVQYAYTTKGTVFHTLSNAEYEALTEEEKMNGDVYCIPDREPVINPDQLWEKVGTGTLDIGSDLTDGVNQLNSSLDIIGTGYTLDSKGVTSVPSGTDTVIYSKVLPQGKYLFSAKIYCNVNNASCYLMCGGLRQQLTCANIAYMQLCGLVTSNGSTETALHFYQNSGSAQTRSDNFDEVYLVRIQ